MNETQKWTEDLKKKTKQDFSTFSLRMYVLHDSTRNSSYIVEFEFVDIVCSKFQKYCIFHLQ